MHHFFCFFLVFCCFCFYSCDSSTSGKENSEKKTVVSPKTKLKVLCQPRPSFIPLHIALEEKYFEQEGLDVEFIHMEQGQKALFLLMQGEIDVWAGGSRAGMFNLFSQKTEIKVVANKGCARSQDGTIQKAIVLRKDLVEARKPFALQSLKGLKGYLDPASYAEYHIDECLKKAGLTIQDVDMKRMPDAMLSEALLNGSIDFASMGEPLITMILKKGDFALLFTTEEIIPGFEFGYIAYGKRLLSQEPEIGKKFMLAYAKALRQYAQGKTERNVEIMIKSTKHDKETCLKMGWPFIPPRGEVNLESLKKFQDWALSKGYTKERIEEKQMYDPSFLEYANQILDKAEKK
ncbi:MAG: ABC transporter substrate-binding protein [Candidatus Brocadiae bacterium]|nr:ABC transporter substrate-binding protein [Candidatus Brocadiia bacterium]